MKLQHADYFNEVSPNDIIDTMEIDLNKEERRIFSDAILLAQQYNKYVKDFKNDTRPIMTNRDNITWFRRFIYDALLREDLIKMIDNPMLSKVRHIVAEMEEIGLKFIEDCLQIEKIYEKTIGDISEHPLESFNDIKPFIGECSEAKKRHIIEKIDNIPEKLSSKILF